MLGGATIFAPQAAAFIMTERFSSIRKKLTSTPSEAAQLSADYIYVVATGALRYRARIDADPDIQVRGTTLPYGRGAAHVYTPVIGSSPFGGSCTDIPRTVQARSGSGVEFHQACKGKSFGNVTIKVTRH